MKSPEQYFEETPFVTEEAKAGEFTPAELAFLAKYLGVAGERDPGREAGPRLDPESVPLGGRKPAAPWVEPSAPSARADRPVQSGRPAGGPDGRTAAVGATAAAQAGAGTEPARTAPPVAASARATRPASTERPLRVDPPPASAALVPAAESEATGPAEGQAAPAPQPARTRQASPALRLEKGEIDDLEAQLRSDEDIQLVSFFLGQQEFALPISVIQEVIRYVPPTKLPSAPSFLAGMINLRGRVTPLVRLREVLGCRARESDEDRFIIVCRRKGLQVGLIIQAVATMYRPTQKDLEWNIESQVGVSANCLLGLMKAEERLISIVSIDRLVDRVLKS